MTPAKKTAVLHDADIREPLFEYLEETFGKVRILEEKRTARSRADVVMVTERAVTGIEIKSDADTYARLARQVKDYDLYYDYNYVVVGTSHALHIEEHVPEHWGIVTVERVNQENKAGQNALQEQTGARAEQLDFYMLKKAKKNPSQELFFKLSLLWRPELARLQEQNHMFAYARMSKQFVLEKICEKVSREVLDEQISEALFERDYEKILEQINAYRLEHGMKKRRRKKRGRASKIKLPAKA